jgi:acetyl-CoA carboxylase carboxyl transferase subunit alpha
MSLSILDFEQPIEELHAKIDELMLIEQQHEDADLIHQINQLEKKRDNLTKKIFSHLSAWQVSQIARHPQRPYTLDYIEHMVDDFDEFHGDRAFADDPAIVGGTGRIGEHSVMIIGHQKGRTTQEKVKRNFGMPCPEGYRKAKRLMQMAERFGMPIVTFVDTPGAFPGVGAEERGQSEAIASNLKLIAQLKVPIVCNVIGEGGSGGALAIGYGDQLNMLQYSTYSVISPEGCASILWKDATKAAQASESMAMVAPRLMELKLIDHIFKEPLGGAHRDIKQMTTDLKNGLQSQISSLHGLSANALIKRRYQRLMNQSYNKIACDNWGGW